MSAGKRDPTTTEDTEDTEPLKPKVRILFHLMNIPASHQDWASELTATPNGAQVVRNLVSEPCLDPDVESDFFTRIPSTTLPGSPYDAWKWAKDAVWQTPSLNFKRALVPVGRFADLVRYTLPTQLPDLFPGLDVTASGLSVGDLGRATRAQLELVVEEAQNSSELHLRYVVWVAELTPDLESARAIPPEELLDRLGLPTHYAHVQAGGTCVELLYRRSDLPVGVELHVPSALDGIDNHGFRPEPSCSAPCGTTEPLTAGVGMGFPEAIHQGCDVTPFVVNLL